METNVKDVRKEKEAIGIEIVVMGTEKGTMAEEIEEAVRIATKKWKGGKIEVMEAGEGEVMEIVVIVAEKMENAEMVVTSIEADLKVGIVAVVVEEVVVFAINLKKEIARNI